MPRRLRVAAEFMGTALLVAVVVGSGLMADLLTTNPALALLVNQMATVLALGFLVAVLVPISGAHLNPVVTLSLLLQRRVDPTEAALFLPAQLFGGVFGVVVAQAMFERPLLEFSDRERISQGSFLGEVVATAGLVAVILTLLYQRRASLLPVLVPAWIGSAYFFTSSTSFANPAVTLGRIFTDSFTGISAESAGYFVLAQILGAAIALVLVHPFVRAHRHHTEQKETV